MIYQANVVMWAIAAFVVGIWITAAIIYFAFRNRLEDINELKKERDEARGQRNSWRTKAVDYLDLAQKQAEELERINRDKHDSTIV